MSARRLLVRGIVQGVGFRPFVYRTARSRDLAGWVLNGEAGVDIHVEGDAAAVAAFRAALENGAPPAARIASIEERDVEPAGFASFEIRESTGARRPTVRISPDLPVCAACLAELDDPSDARYGYPYINCTDCGPRFSIVTGLPYDRPRTTMAPWALCARCAAQYVDPLDRRFHAQPVACPGCGPHLVLRRDGEDLGGDAAVIAEGARLLRGGAVLAVKGIGGFHLACDAAQDAAVVALRERKFRKERPFAVMARDLEIARALVTLDAAAEELLTSAARPIVLAPARQARPLIAPDTTELGVMLPYSPVHHLLFAAGAPAILVMTSANRSSEPIAYRDDDAYERLAGVADAFLAGERPIERRIDDSVVRAGVFGPAILRRSRGYSPAAVGTGWPERDPVLAVGADLKNAVTLVVRGQAFVSQHVGDLDQLPARDAFEAICADLCRMYEVRETDLLVVHDAHPDYVTTRWSVARPGCRRAVQHHRAHVASVLAERGAWDRRVVGFAFDGTGYGDDGSIWGGEVFAGSVATGLERIAHLRPARLPGGDAAALFPPQAAAGFLAQLDDVPALSEPPFGFPERFAMALDMARAGERCHETTSIGRLFDAAAALCGFARSITYEGQAAMWLEQLARQSGPVAPYSCPWSGEELDFRPLLAAVLADLRRGRARAEVARAFHGALAEALSAGAARLADEYGVTLVVLSGGVFQNGLLLEEFRGRVPSPPPFEVWLNRDVPPNDGGISLGQAALALIAPD